MSSTINHNRNNRSGYTVLEAIASMAMLLAFTALIMQFTGMTTKLRRDVGLRHRALLQVGNTLELIEASDDLAPESIQSAVDQSSQQLEQSNDRFRLESTSQEHAVGETDGMSVTIRAVQDANSRGRVLAQLTRWFPASRRDDASNQEPSDGS